MSNKEFSVKLEKRTMDFAVNVIRFCSSLPSKIEYNVIKNQLVKSATSIGANYREANRSESRADFKHKISICSKEASETQYWLEIICKLTKDSAELSNLLTESGELLAIFASIVKTLKSKI